MKDEKTWKVYGDAECPYCDELLYFEEEEADVELDFGFVYVNWQAHCTECGKKFRTREVYKLDYTRIIEED